MSALDLSNPIHRQDGCLSWSLTQFEGHSKNSVLLQEYLSSGCINENEIHDLEANTEEKKKRQNNFTN